MRHVLAWLARVRRDAGDGPGRPRRSKGARSYDLLDLRYMGDSPRWQNEMRIRALCHTAYLGPGQAICRVLGRYKMFIDAADVGLSMHLALEGYWEMWVTEAMLRRLRPGMVAVDVGANLGYFSLIMAELCGPAGRVHAVEPNPALAARLRQTLNVNGMAPWSVVHEVALSAEEGTEVTLVVPEREPKNGHLVPWSDGIGGLPMVTRRLDGIEGLRSADFIKIDAEGAEEAIWHGMRGILDAGRPLCVFLEFTPERYRDPAAFIGRILSDGFRLSYVHHIDGVRPATPGMLLSAPPDQDWMLVLER